MMDEMLHVTVAVPAAKVGLLYAALGALHLGTSLDAIASSGAGGRPSMLTVAETPARGSTAVEAAARETTDKSVSGESTAIVETAGDAGEVDAGGHPWSADHHASTKTKTKDGLWRLKVGAARPDHKPGSPAALAAAGTPAPAAEDDDEFAAFREAAAKSDAKEADAAASVKARTWTDADLGKLCNQAALKLGKPDMVKELIAKHVPEGQVAHSRHIPADKREEFAKAVEAKAEITFEG